MTRPVRVATGNPAKMRMLGRFLTAADLLPVMADPGDAEALAPIGYESAVLAKLAGVLAQDPDGRSPVVAHDSGFEFACLGGGPGADTKRWLADVGRDIGEHLAPGTGVTVVHWAALWVGSQTHVFHESDERVVPPSLDLRNSELPLTDCFPGPKAAVDRLMARVTAAIRSHDGEGHR